MSLSHDAWRDQHHEDDGADPCAPNEILDGTAWEEEYAGLDWSLWQLDPETGEPVMYLALVADEEVDR